MVGMRRFNSVKYVGEGFRGAIRELLGPGEEEEGESRPLEISPHAPADMRFYLTQLFLDTAVSLLLYLNQAETF